MKAVESGLRSEPAWLRVHVGLHHFEPEKPTGAQILWNVWDTGEAGNGDFVNKIEAGRLAKRALAPLRGRFSNFLSTTWEGRTDSVRCASSVSNHIGCSTDVLPPFTLLGSTGALSDQRRDTTRLKRYVLRSESSPIVEPMSAGIALRYAATSTWDLRRLAQTDSPSTDGHCPRRLCQRSVRQQKPLWRCRRPATAEPSSLRPFVKNCRPLTYQ